MVRKEESREKMIPLSRHNYIVIDLVKRHGEEIMQLKEVIDKLKRKRAAVPAKRNMRKY